VKQIVYGLGAFGGGVAILSTFIDNYCRYGVVPNVMEDSKKNYIQTLTNQLKAETDVFDNNGDTWPRWDWNWDRRHPLPTESGVATTDGSKKVKVSASRHLILIRHGQYNLEGKEDNQRYLTELGRAQASLTGVRLATLSLPYTHILHSNMTR